MRRPSPADVPREGRLPATPQSPPPPEQTFLCRAPHLRRGDVLWLWRTPSSTLPPSWRVVQHVQHAEGASVVWLADKTGGTLMPHVLRHETSQVVVHRPSGGLPPEGPAPPPGAIT